jgi:MFS family permease
VVGPAVAGMLVAAVGEAWAFGLNGVSYLAVLAGLMMMQVPRFERGATNRAPLLDLMEGLRYVARDPLKRVLLSALVVHSIFGTLHITLMPVFAKNVFVVEGWRLLEDGEARLGILMASFGFGALVGAILIAAIGDRVPSGKRITMGILIFPISFILFSFAPSFWLALPLLAIGGWAMITLLATSNTLLQTTTPDELRGRVMSLYTMTLVGLMPFGHLLAGFLADRFNSAPMAVRIAQCVVLLTGIIMTVFAPHVRRAK